MAEQEIKVCTISCYALAIVIEAVDGSIWQWDTPNALALTIFAVLVLVNVVTKMQHIVYRVLAGWVAKGVEESEREVAARVHGKANLCDKVIGGRCGLGTANRTCHIGFADGELIEVTGVRAEIQGFDLVQLTFWVC